MNRLEKIRKAGIDKAAKITNLAVSSLLLLSGIFLLILPDYGYTWLRWLVGGNWILIGGAKMLGYFSNDMYRLAFQFDLSIGIFCVIIGVLTMLSTDALHPFIPIASGIYITLDGLMKLQISFDAKRFGLNRWLLLILTAAALAAIGVLTLLFTADMEKRGMTMLGVALTADALVNGWFTAYTVHVRARKKNLRYLPDEEADKK